MKFKFTTIAAAVLMASGATLGLVNAHAAGLGGLSVQSVLGQPLRAEVEITSTNAEELKSLSVKLASPEAFKQAGLEFNSSLSGLRFALNKQAGKAVVQITSTQPINEPFIDLLLEISWANGRLVREYTFLLDPPELRAGRPPEVIGPVTSAIAPSPTAPAASSAPAAPASPLPSVASEATSSTAAPAANSSSSAPSSSNATPASRPAASSTNKAAPKPEVKEKVADSATEVKVNAGDTLGKIASRYTASGITLDQMLVALQRNNPQAFIGNNINRLKAGAVLRIPATAEVSTISSAEARKEVIAQTADFSNYRRKLASSVKNETPKVAETEGKALKGQVTPKVEDSSKTATETQRDQVKLAQPKTGTDAKTDLANADAAAAKKKALSEANQRVAELERNLAEMQKLLEQKKQAEAQAALAAKQAASKSTQPEKKPEPEKKAEVAKPTEPVKAAEPSPAVTTKPETPASLASTPAASAAAIPAAPSATASSSAVPATQTEPAANSADATQPTATQATSAPEVPAPEATPAPAAAPVKAPVPAEPSPAPTGGLFADLITNPLAVGGILSILGLTAGLVAYRRYQKKKFAKFQDSILSGDDLKSNSIFAATGGQSVNTGDSAFGSSFIPSASQIASNEVDPIAEADVYIAYGRDAQAEEILKEALKAAPERHAVRLKLLEIYANRKDLGAFGSVAGEFYQMTNGQGIDWNRAAELGRSIDPKNPLYASSGEQGAGSVASSNEAKPVLATPPLAPAQAAAPVAQAQTSALNIPAVELDFSLDTPNANLPPVTTSNFSATIPMQELAQNSTVDFPETSIQTDTFRAAPDNYATSVSEADNLNAVKNSPLDFDFNQLPSSSAKADSALPEMDLSGINLDLDAPKNNEFSSGVEAVSSDPLSSQEQEMATKLDLAAAYQEIGDNEGAKELLEEVIRGGDAEQQTRARKLLASIS